MKIHRIVFAILMATIVGLIGAYNASTASADTSSCTTASNGNVTCVDQTLTQVGQAVDQESSSATAVGHAKTGVTYLVSMHLKLNEQKALREGQCRWFAKAHVAGFKNGTGKLGWKLDHHVHACMSHGRLIKIGGGMTGLDCHNLVKLKKPKGEVKGKVEFVDHMTWQAMVDVQSTATATVGVSVSVHNADFSCQASANSTATSKSTATASATATASSKVSALSQAQGKLAQVLDSVHQQASTNALASAKATATAKASAQATCSPSTSGGPSVSISLSNLTQPQNGPGGIAPDGETATVCITVTDTKPGDTVVLSFGAGLGSFEGGPVTFTSTGVDTKCATYVAPNDSGDVGQTETWTVTALDKTAGVTAASAQVQFTLQAPPTGR